MSLLNEVFGTKDNYKPYWSIVDSHSITPNDGKFARGTLKHGGKLQQYHSSCSTVSA